MINAHDMQIQIMFFKLDSENFNIHNFVNIIIAHTFLKNSQNREIHESLLGI